MYYDGDTMKKKIAIIGAGISGLVLAHELAKYTEVTVFEKARGVGGRMSTRYADPYYFDHGAQYFTARDKAFQQFLTPFIEEGIVAEWTGKVITLAEGKEETKRLWFEPHYVATPHMNSLCKALGKDQDIRLGVEISPLVKSNGSDWNLRDKESNSQGNFDHVISTAPPVQTKRLFAGFMDNSITHNAVMLGCYSLMLGFDKEWDKQWIAAKVNGSPIGWIAVNSSKPKRNASVTSLLVQSTNQWAEDHINDDMKEAELFLIKTLEALLAIDCATAQYITTHRWRYAALQEKQSCLPYYDKALKLGAIGDWFSDSRIEDAWINAMKLKNSIMEDL